MSIDTLKSEGTLHPLIALKDWISQKEGAEVSVVELYGDEPTRLGLSEVELREWVNEGLALQMFALGGLTSAVKVVNRETAHPLPSSPPQRQGH